MQSIDLRKFDDKIQHSVLGSFHANSTAPLHSHLKDNHDQAGAMPALRPFGEPMMFSWWSILYAIAFQVIIIIMLHTCGNPVLFKSKDVRRHPDGALILKPDVTDFVFTAIIFLIGGGMGFAADGWLRVGIWAFFGACLWIAWRANRHRIILTDQHMTVLSWRRFEVFKKDITSYKIERDEDEGDQVMWIEVQAGERKCRLRKGLVGSREQERAMLDFLELKQKGGLAPRA